MSDLTRLHQACRVFLARLLIVHGSDAPGVLRRMADELEGLVADLESEEMPPAPGRRDTEGGNSGGNHAFEMPTKPIELIS